MKLATVLSAASLASFAPFVVGCGSDAGELGYADEEESALTIDGYDEPTAADRDSAMAAHANVDPNHVVPRDLLARALGFFEVNKDRIDNPKYVTVVDFAKHSGKDRFFIVDLDTGRVESHVVAHGSGSDPSNTGYAKRFSNKSGSNASSLGYYLTAETYNGDNGFSLRLDGVSGTNSRVRDRAVVIHGANYVDEGRSRQGRSSGCFALAADESSAVIRKLRGGSVLYAERAGMIDDE
jgi:hypothetical protein